MLLYLTLTYIKPALEQCMKHQCIIVEDNAVERDLLATLLRNIEKVEVAGVFQNGLEALQFLQQHPVDLAFTDVDMPVLSGIGLLKSLTKPPLFIFISAHSRYAADGYELDVLDFIRKPLQPERLYRALDKALERLKHEELKEGSSQEEILMARTSEGMNKLTLGSIIYAESKGNYSMLHLLHKTSILVLVGMKQLEAQLPAERFARVHKNYLVNWQFVDRIGKEFVLVAGKYELPIGDSYRKAMAERVASFPTLERRREK